MMLLLPAPGSTGEDRGASSCRCAADTPRELSCAIEILIVAARTLSISVMALTENGAIPAENAISRTQRSPCRCTGSPPGSANVRGAGNCVHCGLHLKAFRPGSPKRSSLTPSPRPGCPIGSRESVVRTAESTVPGPYTPAAPALIEELVILRRNDTTDDRPECPRGRSLLQFG